MSCDAALGVSCDAALGVSCDAALGVSCDAALGVSCDAALGVSCDAALGVSCDAALGVSCDAVLGVPVQICVHLVRRLHSSFAFNTVIPEKRFDKFQLMSLDSSICYLIFDFLLQRPQLVKINDIVSSSIFLSTGTPQDVSFSRFYTPYSQMTVFPNTPP